MVTRSEHDQNAAAEGKNGVVLEMWAEVRYGCQPLPRTPEGRPGAQEKKGGLGRLEGWRPWAPTAGDAMTQLDSAYPLSHGLSGDQLDLLYGEMRNIEQAFWKFDKQNPRVYRMIVNLARTAKQAGRERYSMHTIFELIRWHHDIELKSREPFKINDHFSSRYARLVMSREPDLCDFFEIRKLRSKTRP